MNEINDIEDDLDDDLDPNIQNVEEGDDDPSEEEVDDESKGSQLSPEQVAEIAAQAAARVNRPQQHKELTPEELDARLNRYKVPADVVKLLRDPEAAPEAIVKVLQDLVDGAAKHAVTSAQLLYQRDLGPLRTEVEAQRHYVREQQISTLVKHVGSMYPALAGKDRVIRQAIDAVNASGYQPPSKTAAQKQVALVARDIIRAVDPSFSLKSNGARQASSFGARRPSGGGGGGQTGAKTGAASFLDYLR